MSHRSYRGSDYIHMIHAWPADLAHMGRSGHRSPESESRAAGKQGWPIQLPKLLPECRRLAGEYDHGGPESSGRSYTFASLSVHSSAQPRPDLDSQRGQLCRPGDFELEGKDFFVF